MLRTTLDKAYIRRTLRPLYAFEHATPRDMLLDPNWAKSVDIYPGMCLMGAATASSGVSDVVTLLDATGVPLGLAGQYVAPTYGIDELAEAGQNSIAVWMLESAKSEARFTWPRLVAPLGEATPVPLDWIDT